MKFFKCKLLLLWIIFSFPSTISAQNQSTFSFLLECPAQSWTHQAVEDHQGNIIALVSELTGIDYGPYQLNKAYLLIFDPQGDTITKNYHFGDTLSYFSAITRTNENTYLIAGFSKLLDTSELFLLLMLVDENLEIIWVVHKPLTGYYIGEITRLMPLGNSYIVAGTICYFPCAGNYFYMINIDLEGNIINEYINNVTSSGYEFILTQDTGFIWIFNGHQSIREVFDTAFNYINTDPIPSQEWLYLNTTWHSDTTFVMSFMCRRTGQPLWDDELCIGILDSALNLLAFNQFGALDTIDYPAIKRAVVLRHPDTIYIAGTKNMSIWPPPVGYGSWIMTGQLDAMLQPRYLHFIGGDAFYRTEYILATSDGGSFICALKYNHDSNIFDRLFLKLNSEGLLVGHRPPGIQIKKSLLYPNPANAEIALECYLPVTTLKVFDLTGRLLLQQQGFPGKTLVNITGLKAGSYILSIYSENQFIESHKFIKY
jgi:hypothetical protein